MRLQPAVEGLLDDGPSTHETRYAQLVHRAVFLPLPFDLRKT